MINRSQFGALDPKALESGEAPCERCHSQNLHQEWTGKHNSLEMYIDYRPIHNPPRATLLTVSLANPWPHPKTKKTRHASQVLGDQ